MSGNILVAVWMVTYNHEKFIEQAVNSVMTQSTSFPFRLYIGEDFSTDNTRNLCIQLKEKFPTQIELILSDVNVGAQQNALRTYQACFESGAEYIAMLEGDDYWTDQNKLQKQVEYLRINSDLVLCGHLVNTQSKGVLEKDKFRSGFFKLEDVIRNGRLCHTVSMVYRNVLDVRDVEFIQKIYSNHTFYSGDQLILLLLLAKGDAYMMDDYMAVYRKHDDGVMQSIVFKSHHNLGFFFLLRDFNILTNRVYDSALKERMKFWLDTLVKRDLSMKNKFIAAYEGLKLNLFLGLRYFFSLPYYAVKSALYKQLRISEKI